MRRSLHRGWRILLVLGTVLGSASVLASSPSAHDLRLRADEAARALEFERVATLAQAGLSAGDAGLADTRELYALLAQAQAVINQAAFSVRSFAVLLELDPTFTLPPGTSPKVLAPLRAARSTAAPPAQALSLSSRTEARGTSALQTRASFRGDVNGVVHRARVWVEGRTIPLPAGGLADWTCTKTPCPFTVQLLDRSGNVLLEESHADAIRPLQVLTEREDLPPRPFFRRPLPYWLAGGILLLGGATATVFYGTAQHEVLVDRADKAHHSFSAYVDASARRNAAGAAAITGYGLGLGLGAVGFAF